MSTLLILGSKPDPALPPRSSYDHVACANASGFSAARQQLPIPRYTVMSAILTSGIDSGKQSLQALRGLRTDTVYFFPRPEKNRSPFKQLVRSLGNFKTSPLYFRWKLKSLGYHYDQFMIKSFADYHDLVKELCDYDPEVLRKMEAKQPSTGVMALALGVADTSYDRYIMSGFSFELTHAYASNPEIHQRGTVASRHADTDIAVIRYLSAKYHTVFTTEVALHQRAGVPLLEDME